MNYQGHNPTLEYLVVNSYKNHWAMIEMVCVNLSMKVIIEANILSLEGRLFKRKSKFRPKEMHAFYAPR